MDKELDLMAKMLALCDDVTPAQAMRAMDWCRHKLLERVGAECEQGPVVHPLDAMVVRKESP